MLTVWLHGVSAVKTPHDKSLNVGAHETCDWHFAYSACAQFKLINDSYINISVQIFSSLNLAAIF